MKTLLPIFLLSVVALSCSTAAEPAAASKDEPRGVTAVGGIILKNKSSFSLDESARPMSPNAKSSRDDSGKNMAAKGKVRPTLILTSLACSIPLELWACR